MHRNTARKVPVLVNEKPLHEGRTYDKLKFRVRLYCCLANLHLVAIFVAKYHSVSIMQMLHCPHLKKGEM